MPTKKFQVNEPVVVVCRSHLAAPKPAKIVAFTSEPGKAVGVQFEEEIPGGHTCDGRCADKRGLWVTPTEIRSEKDYKEYEKHLKERAKESPEYKEFSEMEVTLDRKSHAASARFK